MITTSLLKKQYYSQGEISTECTFPKPLEYIRIRITPSNRVRFTARSKTLGPSFPYLEDESQLLSQQSSLHKILNPRPKHKRPYTSLDRLDFSRRNNRYGDDIGQRRKNKCDRLRAFLIWLCQVEAELGEHSCPVPDIFSYLTPTGNYNGKRIKSECLSFWVFPDGSMSGWDKKSSQWVCSFNIATAKKTILDRLVITDELQEKAQNPRPIGFDNPKRVFTKLAREKLLNAGAVVEDLCPTDSPDHAANFRAITLTLPGSTPEAYRALAAYSSWLLNRLLQVVRDAKFKIHYFGVWELQARGALHIHLGIGADPNEASMEQLEELGNKIAKKWFKLLKEMATLKKISRGGKTGRLPGIDMFKLSPEASERNNGIKTWRNSPDVWKWDNQAIKKNVAAYFSKYASKNVDAGNKGKTFKHYCPSRWWFCSKSINDEIKAQTIDITLPYNPIESNQLIEEIIEVYEPLMRYSYSFGIEMNHENSEGKISRINVVNGITNILFFEKHIFRQVRELILDLIPVFLEVGNHRETRDIQSSDFNYYKFYDNFYGNNAPYSLLTEVEFSLFQKVKFKNIPLANTCH